MANWCSTSFAITGDERALVEKFRDDAIKGNSRKKWEGWLGNIFLSAGYSEQEIEKRFSLRSDDTYITTKEIGGRLVVFIDCETAWSAPVDDMRILLQEKYSDDLELYYMAEEPGLEIYDNSDDSGLYFPTRYTIYYECENGDSDKKYYDERSVDSLVSLIRILTERDWDGIDYILNHTDEVEEAFRAKNGEDGYISIHEFENCWF